MGGLSTLQTTLKLVLFCEIEVAWLTWVRTHRDQLCNFPWSDEIAGWTLCVFRGPKMRKTFYSSVLVLPKEILLWEKCNTWGLFFPCGSQRWHTRNRKEYKILFCSNVSTCSSHQVQMWAPRNSVVQPTYPRSPVKSEAEFEDQLSSCALYNTVFN